MIDFDPAKFAKLRRRSKTADRLLFSERSTHCSLVLEDAKAVDGSVRVEDGKAMSRRADRPALALYTTMPEDTRLTSTSRAQALRSSNGIADTLLIHRKTSDFAPFSDGSYTDTFGPTVHFPSTPKQIDT